MMRCSWNSEFGIDCLTCGFQRSLSLLAQGQIEESLLVFPATIPFLLTILFLILHLWRKYNHGAKLLVGFFSLTVLLILVNYSVKLASGEALHAINHIH